MSKLNIWPWSSDIAKLPVFELKVTKVNVLPCCDEHKVLTTPPCSSGRATVASSGKKLPDPRSPIIAMRVSTRMRHFRTLSVLLESTVVQLQKYNGRRDVLKIQNSSRRRLDAMRWDGAERRFPSHGSARKIY